MPACAAITKMQHNPANNTSRDHTARSTTVREIAWIERTGRCVSGQWPRTAKGWDEGWTHSKIDLTPEACSLEAGGEKDWRWETAPTLGRGKPSLARLRRCVSSPRHLARAAGHATRVCCEASDTLAQKGATRTDSRTEERAHHPPVVIRSLHAGYPRVTMPTKFLFSNRAPARSHRTIVLGTISIVSNFRHFRVSRFVSLTKRIYERYNMKKKKQYRCRLTFERRIHFLSFTFLFPRRLIIDYRFFFLPLPFSSRFEQSFRHIVINWPDKCAGKCLLVVPLL